MADNEAVFDYENEEIPTRTLKKGLDLRELSTGTEIVFEECDDFNIPPEDDYFKDSNLLSLLKQECLYPQSDDESDEDKNDERTPFEKIATKMTPLTSDRGVLKKEVKSGSGEKLPEKAFVTIHYNAYLDYSDEPFDSSRLRGNPLKFLLDDGKVIRGLDIAVTSMKKGEVSQFLINSDYAYGKMGCPPRIPPEATILYEVELITFIDSYAAIEYEQMSTEEKGNISFANIVKVCKAEHEAGNAFFKQFNHYKALTKYKKAAKLMENARAADENDDKERHHLLLKLYLNITQCFFVQNEYRNAVIFAKKALSIDIKNAKANYRCGKALRKLGEFREAKVCLKRAMRSEPYNPEINNELKELAEQENKYSLFEKKFCKRMFGNTNEEDDNTELTFKYNISDEFKSKIEDCLRNLILDDGMEEIPFSAGFSPGEMACIKQVAKQLGLHFVQQQHGDIKQIKVQKSKS